MPSPSRRFRINDHNLLSASTLQSWPTPNTTKQTRGHPILNEEQLVSGLELLSLLDQAKAFHTMFKLIKKFDITCLIIVMRCSQNSICGLTFSQYLPSENPDLSTDISIMLLYTLDLFVLYLSLHIYVIMTSYTNSDELCVRMGLGWEEITMVFHHADLG